MTEFFYDDYYHQYRLVVDGGERRLSSVSQILQRSGMYGYPKTPSQTAKMSLGTHVHNLTEMYDKKLLTPQDLEETEKGYIEAYQSFVSDNDLLILRSEEPIYHPLYLYGAKPDRIGSIKGGPPIVVEIKTGSFHPANLIQLSAYHEAHNALHPDQKVAGSIAVYLAKTGSYKLVTNSDHERNFSLFLSCMQILAWKDKHGIGKYERDNGPG